MIPPRTAALPEIRQQISTTQFAETFFDYKGLSLKTIRRHVVLASREIHRWKTGSRIMWIGRDPWLTGLENRDTRRKLGHMGALKEPKRVSLQEKLREIDQQLRREMRARGFDPDQDDNVALTAPLAELYTERENLRAELQRLSEHGTSSD